MTPTLFFPRIAIAALALCLSAGASAQTYKCLDAAGKVTYSSATCADLGLRDGGEVRNKVNVSPAQKVEPPQAAPPTARQDGAKPAAAKESAAPERRCFAVHTKTAKGVITRTRCNDDPGMDDPVPTDERSKSENKATN